MSFVLAYDDAADAAYLYLVSNIAPGQAVRQVAVDGVPDGAEVFMDFDSSGTILGIEVLGASVVLAPELLATGIPQR